MNLVANVIDILTNIKFFHTLYNSRISKPFILSKSLFLMEETVKVKACIVRVKACFFSPVTRVHFLWRSIFYNRRWTRGPFSMGSIFYMTPALWYRMKLCESESMCFVARVTRATAVWRWCGVRTSVERGWSGGSSATTWAVSATSGRCPVHTAGNSLCLRRCR